MPKKFINLITDQKFILGIVLATLVILSGMIFLNDIVVSIRLLELKAYLRDIDKKASDMSTVGMVSKFKLHKKLYENKLNEDDLNKEEFNVTSRLLSSDDHDDIPFTKYRELAPPVLAVMNLIRLVLRKPPVEYILSNRENYKLTLAYYTERQKKYNRALEIYDDLLSEDGVKADQIHIILLHQGYCLSIIGDYDRAKEKYLEIIKNFENEDVAITAARLLRFIEELEAEVRKVKESDDSPLIKSEKLYKLIAFKEALEILDKVVEEDEKASDKVQYLRARCYEETGKKETSVTIYQDIVDNSIEEKHYESETAKQANRRILLISATEEEGEKIKELSIKNHELIADPDFQGLLDTAEKLETAFTEEEEKLKEMGKKEFPETGPTPGNKEESGETPSSDAQDEEPGKEITGKEQEFNEFLEDSLKNVEERIDQLIEEKEITPAPTPFPTPVPAQTKAKERRTPVPTNVPEPTEKKGPYSLPYLDDKGNVEKVEDYNETGVLTRVKEFNDSGKIFKLTEFNETTGEMKGYFVYEFDENGNPVKVYAYDADGNLIRDD
ncbi:MAG: tetratricopeptide repeat protein [Spirochaetales bacterium]|nr:tetratricopeptide repeat protein [Spirochaetales bacterium]